MPLKSELEDEVGTIFRTRWETTDGRVVPEDDSISLGNNGTNIDATVLYADLADSTAMVDSQTATLAAEMYKAFLHCAAKIIRSEDGEITAYDGDRIMAVYVGGTKNTSAVRSALKITWAVRNIINPAKNRVYTTNGFVIRHVIGIDTSKLLVAKTGIRGSNDLVWVGRAANHAAKLSALPSNYQTYITKEVYGGMLEDGRTSNGKSMWEAANWNTFDNRLIYRSAWGWVIS